VLSSFRSSASTTDCNPFASMNKYRWMMLLKSSLVDCMDSKNYVMIHHNMDRPMNVACFGWLSILSFPRVDYLNLLTVNRLACERSFSTCMNTIGVFVCWL
jgi:hypothetical protein